MCILGVGNTVLIVPSVIHKLNGANQDFESENGCWEYHGLL